MPLASVDALEILQPQLDGVRLENRIGIDADNNIGLARILVPSHIESLGLFVLEPREFIHDERVIVTDV